MSIRTIAPLLAAAVLALGGSPQPGEARVSGYRVVLVSDLEGGMHGYTIRLDGSRLTRLLTTKRPLAPFAVSRDGRTIAYADERAIYVSRGDGTHLRRVLRGYFSFRALSPDGRMVAYTSGSRGTVSVVRTNGRGRRVLRSSRAEEIAWSPDNRTLVTGGTDRMVRRWDATTGDHIGSVPVSGVDDARNDLRSTGHRVAPQVHRTSASMI